MKIKKYILSLLIGATALSFSSCNDFLDRDPLGQFTEDDAPNALVGGKIFNVYYLMRGYDITAGIPAFMVHMVRSEDSEKGSDAGDGGEQAAMWDDFEYTASNGPLGTLFPGPDGAFLSGSRLGKTPAEICRKVLTNPSFHAKINKSSGRTHKRIWACSRVANGDRL